MKDPKAIRKAIMTAKSVARLIDPHFGRVPLPELGSFGADKPVPEHSPMVHQAYGVPMPEHFAGGGYADGGETPQHPYAVPNDMGLYSHAAVTAANLPQETMSPDDMRQALTGRGVKNSELKWGEYDYAFGHEPKVNRDEVAKHFWVSMPNVEEKVFRKRLPGEPKRHEVRERQYGEEDRFWEHPDRKTETPAEHNQARREMRQRHEAELAGLPHGDPHHERYTIPGGENYREILLKHAGDASFPGVHEHFAGEPDVLASLMMKDRNDTEGKRLAHIEELQSDWAQRGRKNWYELGTNEQGVERAPYVEKTEDWVDLGLKRALLEAARQGHDKLSWSPGHVIADRYDLAKHVDGIFHEKNDDGTHNLVVIGKDGQKIFDREDMSPKDLHEHLGKGVADRIISGEGLSGEEAKRRYEEAEKAQNDFIERLIDNDIARRRGLWHERNPGAEYPQDQEQMVRDIVRPSIVQNPSTHARQQGILDEYEPIKQAHRDAYRTFADMEGFTSPYRDWRKLSGVDLRMGEKWPFEMYDRMIPKQALKLAKQHDPEAKLSNSHIQQGFDFGLHASPEDADWHSEGDEGAVHGGKPITLQSIEITPRMRESILKHGFPAYASGGEVEGYATKGAVEEHTGAELMRRNPDLAENTPRMEGDFAAAPAMPLHEMSARYERVGEMEPWREKHPEELVKEGAIMFPALHDLTMADRMLTHIGENKLDRPINLSGGSEYQRIPRRGAWASRFQKAMEVARKMHLQNPEGRLAYMVGTTMGLPSADSSHMMVQAIMRQIPHSKISQKAAEALDAQIRKKDPEWPGILNHERAEAHLLRKDSKGGKDYVGTRVSNLIQSLDTMGWRNWGIPGLGQARFAISEKRLLGAPQFSSGFSMSRVSPEKGVYEDPEDPHGTYSGIYHRGEGEGGGYAGGFKHIVPASKMFPEWYARQPQTMLIKKTGEHVPMKATNFQQALLTQHPGQVATQEWLDTVMPEYEKGKKWGYKKGGTVRKALMIAKGKKTK